MSKFEGLFIGRSVRVKSLTTNHDWQQWVVIDIRSIYTEDGEVMNPVTLLTLDRDGVPHIITLPHPSSSVGWRLDESADK